MEDPWLAAFVAPDTWSADATSRLVSTHPAGLLLDCLAGILSARAERPLQQKEEEMKGVVAAAAPGRWGTKGSCWCRHTASAPDSGPCRAWFFPATFANLAAVAGSPYAAATAAAERPCAGTWHRAAPWQRGWAQPAERLPSTARPC